MIQTIENKKGGEGCEKVRKGGRKRAKTRKKGLRASAEVPPHRSAAGAARAGCTVSRYCICN